MRASIPPAFNAKEDAYHEKLRKARHDPRVKRYINGVESYNREINLTSSVSKPKPSERAEPADLPELRQGPDAYVK